MSAGREALPKLFGTPMIRLGALSCASAKLRGKNNSETKSTEK